MIQNLRNGDFYSNRKEAKMRLGGLGAYNASMRRGELLFINGIQLITKLKNKMKSSLMSVSDKVLLRKRSIIESINDELKNMTQIEHSRHRSFHNFVNNFIAGLAAYSYFPKKPMLNLERSVDKQLALW